MIIIEKFKNRFVSSSTKQTVLVLFIFMRKYGKISMIKNILRKREQNDKNKRCKNKRKLIRNRSI